MRSFLRRVVLCFLGACSLFATGCSSPVDPSVIQFGVSRVATKLDPRFSTDAESSRINRLLYDQLTDTDDEFVARPGIADWVQVNPTTYLFTLIKARQFSNGQPLTAQDVVATYHSVLDAKTGSPYRATLSKIIGVEAVSDQQVRFTLSEPDALFTMYMSVGILPANLIQQRHDFTRDPVGSGEFVVVDKETDQFLLLERKRDNQRIRFLRVQDPSVRVIKLVKGELDIIQNDLLPELESYLRNHQSVQTANLPGMNYAYIGFNLADETTGESDIRRAIGLGIDRQQLMANLLKGKERLANGIFPPEHWVSSTDAPLAFDPVLARQLLAKHGYTKSNPLAISYKTSTDPLRVRIATFIQQQLAEINVRVTLQTYDWGTFYGDIKAGRFQMYSLIWVGITSPDFYQHVFFSGSLPPDGANRGRYNNPRVDALLDGVNTLNMQQQVQKYREIQSIINNDLPYISLWYEDHFIAQSHRVSMQAVAPDGNYDYLMTVALKN